MAGCSCRLAAPGGRRLRRHRGFRHRADRGAAVGAAAELIACAVDVRNVVVAVEYHSPTWAAKFLDDWCQQVMRSRIEPMKKVAKTLLGHRELILKYFRDKKQFSSGVIQHRRHGGVNGRGKGR